jgi:hypothetical protein
MPESLHVFADFIMQTVNTQPIITAATSPKELEI